MLPARPDPDVDPTASRIATDRKPGIGQAAAECPAGLEVVELERTAEDRTAQL